jgi:Rad3-related DNA helicase
MPLTESFHWRPHQREAVEAIQRNFEGGAEAVVLEAPTGAGKSLINTTVAAGFSAGFYTSAQVALVDQIAADPLLEDRVATVYGKSNYECALPEMAGTHLTVDLAPCETGMTCKSCNGTGQVGESACTDCRGKESRRFECSMALAPPVSTGGFPPPQCPYYAAKFLASQSPIALMTLAYLLLASTPIAEPKGDWGLVNGRFPPRSLLVVDEAHAAAEFASRFISLSLSPRKLHGEELQAVWRRVRKGAFAVRDEASLNSFLHDAFAPELVESRRFLLELLREGGDRARYARKTLPGVESLIERVGLALEDLDAGNPWVVDVRPAEDKVVLQPVLIGPFLQRRLWNRAEKILLSSATVMDPSLFMRELGLEGRPFAFLQMPSAFPPERAPVLDATVTSLGRRTKAEGEPRALAQLCRILDREKGRGIVHCHSYRNAAFIRENVPAAYRDRLVFHESSDRGDVLNEWLTDGRRDSVLVSVAMTEGLDLRDDLARFAVIWKVPYPDLSDKKVSRRLAMPDGEHWYGIVTMRTVIQAAGRIVRSETDEGRVYIIDGAFHDLLPKTWRWIPSWFKERLQTGGFRVRLPQPAFSRFARPHGRRRV